MLDMAMTIAPAIGKSSTINRERFIHSRSTFCLLDIHREISIQSLHLSQTLFHRRTMVWAHGLGVFLEDKSWDIVSRGFGAVVTPSNTTLRG